MSALAGNLCIRRRALKLLMVPFCASLRCFSQSSSRDMPIRSSVEPFLQDFLARNGGSDGTARYVAAYASLDENARDAVVVYMISQSLCGSGGCITLVLAPEGDSYQLVTKITITSSRLECLTRPRMDGTIWQCLSRGAVSYLDTKASFHLTA
jgi:hypothetical protein